MKRHCGYAFATFIAAVMYGCGGGSETGEGGGAQTQTGGTGGATNPASGGTGGYGIGGNAATGSTWAPVLGGIGGASGGGAGQGGIGGTGGVAAGTGGIPGGGMGGMPPAGAGGMGAGMSGMSGMGGTGGTPATGGKTPQIPAVTGECPDFRDGTITFMGLGGIQVVAGAKAAGPTAPMVFYWHGTGSFAGEFSGMAADVAAGVRAEGGVLISFQGTTGGDFLSGTSIFGAGDFELADQLVACAVQNHNVDPRRIFATGCSAGGLFSTAMAAMRSEYMAAVAPNSGGFTGIPITFSSDYTPPLMTIHGAAGRDVVIIDFADSSANADAAFKARGGFVINCDHGGGHCGGGGLAGSIWEFFKAHPYGVEPSPTPWTSLPAGFHSSCVIY
jgi:predicted esterase